MVSAWQNSKMATTVLLAYNLPMHKGAYCGSGDRPNEEQKAKSHERKGGGIWRIKKMAPWRC